MSRTKPLTFATTCFTHGVLLILAMDTSETGSSDEDQLPRLATCLFHWSSETNLFPDLIGPIQRRSRDPCLNLLQDWLDPRRNGLVAINVQTELPRSDTKKKFQDGTTASDSYRKRPTAMLEGSKKTRYRRSIINAPHPP